jgi:hypothetical protein
MSGCFLQEHVLSPKLQFLILDSLWLESLDNLANVSQFTVFMSILESQELLDSCTDPVYHNLKFASSTSFWGHIRFWTSVETISNGCQLTQRDMVVELQFISKPICVVSPCGPGKVRTNCSAHNEGICSVCPSGTYVIISTTTCSRCPANTNSAAQSTSLTACLLPGRRLIQMLTCECVTLSDSNPQGKEMDHKN